MDSDGFVVFGGIVAVDTVAASDSTLVGGHLEVVEQSELEMDNRRWRWVESRIELRFFVAPGVFGAVVGRDVLVQGAVVVGGGGVDSDGSDDDGGDDDGGPEEVSL